MHAKLEDHASETTSLVAQGPSLNTLEEAERDWSTRKQELDLWRKTLTDRVAALEKEVAELDALRALWERADAQAREQSAPAAVLERTANAVAEVGAAKERVAVRRNTLLDLQDRVAKEEAVVQDVLSQLRKAQETVRGHMLQPDGPPLWSAVWRLGSGERVMAPLREAGARDVEQLGEFAWRSRDHLAPLAILVAILCAGALALRKRVGRWSEEDPDLGRAIHIFDRPVSIAVLTLILLIFWIYPRAPDVLRALLTAIMVIPVLRLLPPMVDRAFHPMLYALMAFFVADQLREMLEAAPDLERVAFAVEVNAAVVVFAWLMRPARLREIPSSVRLPRYLVWGLRALLVLLLASFLANLFGYVSLSRILGTGPLRSAYAAVVLYSGALVAGAVLQVALHTRAARSLGMIRERGSTVLQWGSRLVALGAAAWWVSVTLRQFELSDALGGAFTRILDASLGLGTIEVSVRGVVTLGLVILGAMVLSRLTRFVLEEDVYPRTSLQRGASNAISTLLHYSVLTLGFLLALGAAGIEMSRFALLAGAFGSTTSSRA
jgi:small-conductance mechanosensitive channel